jgi:hypothetical protein
VKPGLQQLDIERAKALLASDLGDVYRDILRAACAPIYWYDRATQGTGILDGGTLTLAKMPNRIIGITAAHVVREYESAKARSTVQLQIMNAVVNDLEIIAISDRFDLATIVLSPTLLESLGKETAPLSAWPPEVPQEGKGIMLAGFPAGDLIESPAREINFGLFTVLGVARRVTDEQVTWVLEEEHVLPVPHIPAPPENYSLGGISGGPLVGWFETRSGIAYPKLCAIISQAHAGLNNVVAKRADLIASDGTIRECS